MPKKENCPELKMIQKCNIMQYVEDQRVITSLHMNVPTDTENYQTYLQCIANNINKIITLYWCIW